MKRHNRLLIAAIACLMFVFPAALFAGELHGNLQYGYVPEVEGFEVQINLHYLPFRWLDLYGGFSTLMDFGGVGYSGMTFYPYRDTYTIGLTLKVGKVVYLNLDHSCTHPVYSFPEQFYDKFEGGNRTTYAVGLRW